MTFLIDASGAKDVLLIYNTQKEVIKPIFKEIEANIQK